MGKKLVIRGADFSANAINVVTTWYVDDYDTCATNNIVPNDTAIASYAGFSPNYDFGGKTINVIKFYAKIAGTITLFVGSDYMDSSATEVGTITIQSAEVGTVVTKNIQDISVPAGKVFFVGKTSDSGAFGYANSTTTGGSQISQFAPFKMRCGTGNAIFDSNTDECLGLNIGYIG